MADLMWWVYLFFWGFFVLGSLFLLAKQEVELYRYGMCQQTVSLAFFLSFTNRIRKIICVFTIWKPVASSINETAV